MKKKVIRKEKSFSKLGLKAQKMKIVTDAISQINAGVIIPDKGTYIALNHVNTHIYGSYDFTIQKIAGKEHDLQKILVEATKKTCKVCGKGGLFAACVLNTDKVNIAKHNYKSELFQSRKLHKWFEYKELDMIETAFEKGVIIDRTKSLQKGRNIYRPQTTELGEKCISFGKKYRSDKARLLAILENILENGKFKP